ncbi:helix-turn-helix domain-containing protein [Parafrankia sp. EUN1f]|uniref:winged helix-turn-helix transcriptional regulator n=1 Tax=Parafrankia sp. EUN1f TaxID=102897 RepID=UPI0001C45E76|nr:helix-turn-helix domain-containing protein [Parafrankia sp. EUN1f]EFC82779.1 transcriptional regulator, HxlR family [Parafrankia sp. EUN1f]
MTTGAADETDHHRIATVLAARGEDACHVREVLDRIGDKWSIAVVHKLADSPRRFSELRRDIPGISQRMLTAALRGLERDGFVDRTVHASVPPRVDYALTPLGRALLDSTWPLMNWVLGHTDDIRDARREYDAR